MPTEKEPEVGQPLLVVIHTPDAFSPIQIAEAADGICRFLWLIDTTARTDPGYRRVMSKFGQVIDHGGMSFDQLVDEVGKADPAGIVTFTDDGQMLTSALAHHLGLEFHPAEVVERLIDKVAQRTALAAAGFEGPTFWTVPPGAAPDRAWPDQTPQYTLADDVVAEVTDAAGFPVVVKPRQGAASRDTYRADDAATLRDVLAANADQEMIVETYLADVTPLDTQDVSDFVSVESAIVDGEVRHLAVTGRFPLAPPFRGSGMFIPSQLPADLIAEIEQLAADAAVALGVRTSIMHTEIKVTPDGPRIIEVNGRVGGGVPDILRLLGGPALIRWRLLLALGLDLPVEKSRPFDGIGFYLWHQPPIGAQRIVTVNGLDEVAALPGVLEVRPKRGPGDLVDWREGGVGHVFGVGGVVATYKNLVSLRHRILDVTSVEYA
jgi:ATP-grasp domain